ncbi:MAG: hypothetical protein BA863_01775 [Desulfovibrio sp. S3730MH75]|nr:MAG: hypothetical protein BA863_01775 [Desulfovibrio sp. S3730MH75]
MGKPNSKPTTWKSKKWRDSAKDQPCTMRLYGCCNGNPETTVLAHENGAGMGKKADDFNAADMCSECHDVWDGRAKYNIRPETLRECFETARLRTIKNRLERKILK